VFIDKPMTIEAVAGDVPVLLNTGVASIVVSRVPRGTVILHALTFRNVSGSASVIVRDTYDQVVIAGSVFEVADRDRDGIFVVESTVPGAAVRVQWSQFNGGRIGVFALGPLVLDVVNNAFADQSLSAVLYASGASGRIEANSAERCGGDGCIRAVRYGNLEVLGNRLTADVGRLTNWGVFASAEPGQGSLAIRDNEIIGRGEVPNRADPSAFYAWRIAGIEVSIGSGIVSGNTIVNAQTGVLSRVFNAPLTVSGSDNVIEFVLAGLFAEKGATLALERSDVTDYVVPLTGLGTFRVPCNWWGSANGPLNVPSNITESAYAPFATEPIARRADVTCE
jgi:hypothetical protein